MPHERYRTGMANLFHPAGHIRYLKKSAGLTYPSAPNMFNIQYIKLWQGEQTFSVLERIPVLYPESLSYC